MKSSWAVSVIFACVSAAADWEAGTIIRISRQPFAGEGFKHATVYTAELPDREISFAVSNKTAFTGYPKDRLFQIGDSIKLRLDGAEHVVVQEKGGRERKLPLKGETWARRPPRT